MRLGRWICFAACVASAPAYAEEVAVSAPAGQAGQAAIVIARQTGTSIIITDSVIAKRSVTAIRGRFSAQEAVARLARAAGARAVPAGPSGWRLVAAQPVAARPVPTPAPRPAPVASAPPAEEASEIVVIASKRGVTLSDYPGQVEMIDGEDLEFGGVGGTEKITQRVPTVASTYLGSGRNKLFVRGIADSSFTGPTQSTVGQYLGDLRLSYNAPDPDLRLSDLKRVEVLEGPQGTLYGAGSLGGIIRLVPNDPEMGVAGGSAMVGGSATQHGALGADASATANLPLVGDRAALRFTVNLETQGGYIDKPLLGEENVNRTQIYSGRAMARVALSDDWTVDLIGVAQQTDGRDSQYADRDGPPLSRAASVTEGFDTDFAQGQVVLTGQLGDVQFKTSTGVTGQDLEERYDATPPDGSPRLFVQRNDTAMIANETRLWQPIGDRFGWLAGVSYTHNRTSLTRTLGEPNTPGAVTGVTNIIDEFTGYGEGSLRLLDGLVATAGARYTSSRLSGEGEDVAAALAASMAAVTTSRTEDVFLPSASLVATVLPDTALYLRYQEGFRPGGLAIAGDFVTRFRNDRIATFELGARHGHPGSGPFDIAANVAYTRWKDIQADFIDSAGLPSTANIGDGRIWSATIIAGVAVTPALRIDAGFTYNDGKIDEPSALLLARVTPVLDIPNFSGRIEDLPASLLENITEIPNVARFSGRIGFDYRRPVGTDLELTAQGWANYVGRSRLGVGPELGETQGDYLDTGLTVRLGRSDLGVTLGLTNLTDEVGNRFALGTPFAVGRDQITPLRPRTIRIGVDAAF
ncbi:MAG: TonB-dependent receptor [Porphyrobacter sp.]|nr:TonB-dependent receptor [Porphyrobacter sp.]